MISIHHPDQALQSQKSNLSPADPGFTPYLRSMYARILYLHTEKSYTETRISRSYSRKHYKITKSIFYI